MSTHTLIEALERIAALPTLDSLIDAKRIALSALATHRAGTGELPEQWKVDNTKDAFKHALGRTLPPLAAAAIQESPEPPLVPASPETMAWIAAMTKKWPPTCVAAPPPADVEVPQRREPVVVNKCDTCDGYGHKVESDPRYAGYSYCPDCPNGRRLIARAYPTSCGVEPPRPEAAPTCGTCGRRLQAEGAIQCCAAPRALQGECKAWCGTPIKALPTEGLIAYFRGSHGYCTVKCKAAERPLHPPATPERP